MSAKETARAGYIFYNKEREKVYCNKSFVNAHKKHACNIYLYLCYIGSRRQQQQQQQASPQQAAREVLTVVKRETANSNGNIEERGCCTHRQQLRLKKLLCLMICSAAATGSAQEWKRGSTRVGEGRDRVAECVCRTGAETRHVCH